MVDGRIEQVCWSVVPAVLCMGQPLESWVGDDVEGSIEGGEGRIWAGEVGKEVRFETICGGAAKLQEHPRKVRALSGIRRMNWG